MSSCRWPVMEQVAKRMIEQWDALTFYFQSFLVDEEERKARKLYEGLKNVDLHIFYSFLAYILPLVNKLNVEFQSEEVRIHGHLSTIEAGLGYEDV